MLPQRYRRLLKRRLRLRPLLPFLLAATLAVDAVIVASGQRLGPLAGGFLVSQLGLLAIWATGSPRRVLARLLVAMAGLLVLLCIVETVDVASEGVAGPLLASMFLVQCAAAAGVHATARAMSKQRWLHRRMRFSVGTLLLAMLLVAAVTTFSRFGDWSPVLDRDIALLLIAEAIPLAVILALAYASPPGWRRHALLIGTPLACVAFGLVLASRGLVDGLSVYYTVQALILGGWLAAIQVRCQAETPKVEESESIDEAPAAQALPEETLGEAPPAEPFLMTIPMRFDSSV